MDSSTAAQIAALEAQLKANPKLAAVAEQRGLTKSKNAKKPRQAPEAEIRCMARVWGSGFGDDQCKAKRLEFGVFSCFCKRHAKQASVCEGPTWVGATGKSPVGLKFGRIDEARPWLDVNAPEDTVPFICVEWKGDHKLEVSAAIESVTAVRVRRGKPKRGASSWAFSKATPTVRRKPLVIVKSTPKPAAETKWEFEAPVLAVKSAAAIRVADQAPLLLVREAAIETVQLTVDAKRSAAAAVHAAAAAFLRPKGDAANGDIKPNESHSTKSISMTLPDSDSATDSTADLASFIAEAATGDTEDLRSLIAGAEDADLSIDKDGAADLATLLHEVTTQSA